MDFNTIMLVDIDDIDNHFSCPNSAAGSSENNLLVVDDWREEIEDLQANTPRDSLSAEDQSIASRNSDENPVTPYELKECSVILERLDTASYNQPVKASCDGSECSVEDWQSSISSFITWDEAFGDSQSSAPSQPSYRPNDFREKESIVAVQQISPEAQPRCSSPILQREQVVIAAVPDRVIFPSLEIGVVRTPQVFAHNEGAEVEFAPAKVTDLAADNMPSQDSIEKLLPLSVRVEKLNNDEVVKRLRNSQDCIEPEQEKLTLMFSCTGHDYTNELNTEGLQRRRRPDLKPLYIDTDFASPLFPKPLSPLSSQEESDNDEMRELVELINERFQEGADTSEDRISLSPEPTVHENTTLNVIPHIAKETAALKTDDDSNTTLSLVSAEQGMTILTAGSSLQESAARNSNDCNEGNMHLHAPSLPHTNSIANVDSVEQEVTFTNLKSLNLATHPPKPLYKLSLDNLNQSESVIQEESTVSAKTSLERLPTESAAQISIEDIPPSTQPSESSCTNSLPHAPVEGRTNTHPTADVDEKIVNDNDEVIESLTQSSKPAANTDDVSDQPSISLTEKGNTTCEQYEFAYEKETSIAIQPTVHVNKTPKDLSSEERPSTGVLLPANDETNNVPPADNSETEDTDYQTNPIQPISLTNQTAQISDPALDSLSCKPASPADSYVTADEYQSAGKDDSELANTDHVKGLSPSAAAGNDVVKGDESENQSRNKEVVVVVPKFPTEEFKSRMENLKNNEVKGQIVTIPAKASNTDKNQPTTKTVEQSDTQVTNTRVQSPMIIKPAARRKLRLKYKAGQTISVNLSNNAKINVNVPDNMIMEYVVGSPGSDEPHFIHYCSTEPDGAKGAIQFEAIPPPSYVKVKQVNNSNGPAANITLTDLFSKIKCLNHETQPKKAITKPFLPKKDVSKTARGKYQSMAAKLQKLQMNRSDILETFGTRTKSSVRIPSTKNKDKDKDYYPHESIADLPARPSSRRSRSSCDYKALDLSTDSEMDEQPEVHPEVVTRVIEPTSESTNELTADDSENEADVDPALMQCSEFTCRIELFDLKHSKNYAPVIEKLLQPPAMSRRPSTPRLLQLNEFQRSVTASFQPFNQKYFGTCPHGGLNVCADLLTCTSCEGKLGTVTVAEKQCGMCSVAFCLMHIRYLQCPHQFELRLSERCSMCICSALVPCMTCNKCQMKVCQSCQLKLLFSKSAVYGLIRKTQTAKRTGHRNEETKATQKPTKPLKKLSDLVIQAATSSTPTQKSELCSPGNDSSELSARGATSLVPYDDSEDSDISLIEEHSISGRVVCEADSTVKDSLLQIKSELLEQEPIASHLGTIQDSPPNSKRFLDIRDAFQQSTSTDREVLPLPNVPILDQSETIPLADIIPPVVETFNQTKVETLPYDASEYLTTAGEVGGRLSLVTESSIGDLLDDVLNVLETNTFASSAETENVIKTEEGKVESRIATRSSKSKLLSAADSQQTMIRQLDGTPESTSSEEHNDETRLQGNTTHKPLNTNTTDASSQLAETITETSGKKRGRKPSLTKADSKIDRGKLRKGLMKRKSLKSPIDLGGKKSPDDVEWTVKPPLKTYKRKPKKPTKDHVEMMCKNLGVNYKLERTGFTCTEISSAQDSQPPDPRDSEAVVRHLLNDVVNLIVCKHNHSKCLNDGHEFKCLHSTHHLLTPKTLLMSTDQDQVIADTLEDMLDVFSCPDYDRKSKSEGKTKCQKARCKESRESGGYPCYLDPYTSRFHINSLKKKHLRMLKAEKVKKYDKSRPVSAQSIQSELKITLTDSAVSKRSEIWQPESAQINRSEPLTSLEAKIDRILREAQDATLRESEASRCEGMASSSVFSISSSDLGSPARNTELEIENLGKKVKKNLRRSTIDRPDKQAPQSMTPTTDKRVTKTVDEQREDNSRKKKRGKEKKSETSGSEREKSDKKNKKKKMNKSPGRKSKGSVSGDRKDVIKYKLKDMIDTVVCELEHPKCPKPVCSFTHNPELTLSMTDDEVVVAEMLAGITSAVECELDHKGYLRRYPTLCKIGRNCISSSKVCIVAKMQEPRKLAFERINWRRLHVYTPELDEIRETSQLTWEKWSQQAVEMVQSNPYKEQHKKYMNYLRVHDPELFNKKKSKRADETSVVNGEVSNSNQKSKKKTGEDLEEGEITTDKKEFKNHEDEDNSDLEAINEITENIVLPESEESVDSETNSIDDADLIGAQYVERPKKRLRKKILCRKKEVWQAERTELIKARRRTLAHMGTPRSHVLSQLVQLEAQKKCAEIILPKNLPIMCVEVVQRRNFPFPLDLELSIDQLSVLILSLQPNLSAEESASLFKEALQMKASPLMSDAQLLYHLITFLSNTDNLAESVHLFLDAISRYGICTDMVCPIPTCNTPTYDNWLQVGAHVLSHLLPVYTKYMSTAFRCTDCSEGFPTTYHHLYHHYNTHADTIYTPPKLIGFSSHLLMKLFTSELYMNMFTRWSTDLMSNTWRTVEDYSSFMSDQPQADNTEPQTFDAIEEEAFICWYCCLPVSGRLLFYRHLLQEAMAGGGVMSGLVFLNTERSEECSLKVEKSREIGQEGDGGKLEICPFEGCNFTSSELLSLASHTPTHIPAHLHENITYQCSKCRDVFDNFYFALHHWRDKGRGCARSSGARLLPSVFTGHDLTSEHWTYDITCTHDNNFTKFKKYTFCSNYKSCLHILCWVCQKLFKDDPEDLSLLSINDCIDILRDRLQEHLTNEHGVEKPRWVKPRQKDKNQDMEEEDDRSTDVSDVEPETKRPAKLTRPSQLKPSHSQSVNSKHSRFNRHQSTRTTRYNSLPKRGERTSARLQKAKKKLSQIKLRNQQRADEKSADKTKKEVAKKDGLKKDGVKRGRGRPRKIPIVESTVECADSEQEANKATKRQLRLRKEKPVSVDENKDIYECDTDTSPVDDDVENTQQQVQEVQQQPMSQTVEDIEPPESEYVMTIIKPSDVSPDQFVVNVETAALETEIVMVTNGVGVFDLKADGVDLRTEDAQVASEQLDLVTQEQSANIVLRSLLSGQWEPESISLDDCLQTDEFVVDVQNCPAQANERASTEMRSSGEVDIESVKDTVPKLKRPQAAHQETVERGSSSIVNAYESSLTSTSNQPSSMLETIAISLDDQDLPLDLSSHSQSDVEPKPDDNTEETANKLQVKCLEHADNIPAILTSPTIIDEAQIRTLFNSYQVEDANGQSTSERGVGQLEQATPNSLPDKGLKEKTAETVQNSAQPASTCRESRRRARIDRGVESSEASTKSSRHKGRRVKAALSTDATGSVTQETDNKSPRRKYRKVDQVDPISNEVQSLTPARSKDSRLKTKQHPATTVEKSTAKEIIVPQSSQMSSYIQQEEVSRGDEGYVLHLQFRVADGEEGMKGRPRQAKANPTAESKDIVKPKTKKSAVKKFDTRPLSTRKTRSSVEVLDQKSTDSKPEAETDPQSEIPCSDTVVTDLTTITLSKGSTDHTRSDEPTSSTARECLTSDIFVKETPMFDQTASSLSAQQLDKSSPSSKEKQTSELSVKVNKPPLKIDEGKFKKVKIAFAEYLRRGKTKAASEPKGKRIDGETVNLTSNTVSLAGESATPNRDSSLERKLSAEDVASVENETVGAGDSLSGMADEREPEDIVTSSPKRSTEAKLVKSSVESMPELQQRSTTGSEQKTVELATDVNKSTPKIDPGQSKKVKIAFEEYLRRSRAKAAKKADGVNTENSQSPIDEQPDNPTGHSLASSVEEKGSAGAGVTVKEQTDKVNNEAAGPDLHRIETNVTIIAEETIKQTVLPEIVSQPIFSTHVEHLEMVAIETMIVVERAERVKPEITRIATVMSTFSEHPLPQTAVVEIAVSLEAPITLDPQPTQIQSEDCLPTTVLTESDITLPETGLIGLEESSCPQETQADATSTNIKSESDPNVISAESIVTNALTEDPPAPAVDEPERAEKSEIQTRRFRSRSGESEMRLRMRSKSGETQKDKTTVVAKKATSSSVGKSALSNKQRKPVALKQKDPQPPNADGTCEKELSVNEGARPRLRCRSKSGEKDTKASETKKSESKQAVEKKLKKAKLADTAKTKRQNTEKPSAKRTVDNNGTKLKCEKRSRSADADQTTMSKLNRRPVQAGLPSKSSKRLKAAKQQATVEDQTTTETKTSGDVPRAFTTGKNMRKMVEQASVGGSKVNSGIPSDQLKSKPQASKNAPSAVNPTKKNGKSKVVGKTTAGTKTDSVPSADNSSKVSLSQRVKKDVIEEIPAKKSKPSSAEMQVPPVNLIPSNKAEPDMFMNPPPKILPKASTQPPDPTIYHFNSDEELSPDRKPISTAPLPALVSQPPLIFPPTNQMRSNSIPGSHRPLSPALPVNTLKRNPPLIHYSSDRRPSSTSVERSEILNSFNTTNERKVYQYRKMRQTESSTSSQSAGTSGQKSSLTTMSTEGRSYTLDEKIECKMCAAVKKNSSYHTAHNFPHIIAHVNHHLDMNACCFCGVAMDHTDVLVHTILHHTDADKHLKDRLVEQVFKNRMKNKTTVLGRKPEGDSHMIETTKSITNLKSPQKVIPVRKCTDLTDSNVNLLKRQNLKDKYTQRKLLEQKQPLRKLHQTTRLPVTIHTKVNPLKPEQPSTSKTPHLTEKPTRKLSGISSPAKKRKLKSQEPDKRIATTSKRLKKRPPAAQKLSENISAGEGQEKSKHSKSPKSGTTPGRDKDKMNKSKLSESQATHSLRSKGLKKKIKKSKPQSDTEHDEYMTMTTHDGQVVRIKVDGSTAELVDM